MKFAIKTLGCKMNSLDSAKLRASLAESGWEEAGFSRAEIVFVNSCIVTHQATKKSLVEAKKVLKAKKQLVIFGCGSAVEKKQLEAKFPSALVFASPQKLLRHFGVKASEDYFSSFPRTRIPIAIQTGCDCVCTFCITKVARGFHRNLMQIKIIRAIQKAESLGAKEVVLTGINVGAFGCRNSNLAQQSKLPHLLNTILEKTKIPRIRISSLGVQYLSKKFFEVFRHPRICNHLHLSIQSASDRILAKMGRNYRKKDILEAVSSARKTRRNLALAADFIVGFPGEDEKDFSETYDLVQKIGFAKLHVFPFSRREKTPANDFPDQVDEKVKKFRASKLRKLGERQRKEFIAKNLGKSLEILVESDSSGLTGNYIRVKVKGGKENEIRKVKLTKKNIAKDTFS